MPWPLPPIPQIELAGLFVQSAPVKHCLHVVIFFSNMAGRNSGLSVRTAPTKVVRKLQAVFDPVVFNSPKHVDLLHNNVWSSLPVPQPARIVTEPELVDLVSDDDDDVFTLCKQPVVTNLIHGCSYTSQFLNEEFSMQLLEYCDGLDFQLYPYRGQYLKRSPKVEFRRDASVGPYRWGQEIRSHRWGENQFPDLLAKLAAAVDPAVNHIIIVRYDHGINHHFPWHHDKMQGAPGVGAKDIVADSNVYNITVCAEPRVFQLALADHIPESADGHAEAVQYVFNEPLEHGSMLKLSAEGNKVMKHRVPKSPGFTGPRFSIVLRQMKLLS